MSRLLGSQAVTPDAQRQINIRTSGVLPFLSTSFWMQGRSRKDIQRWAKFGRYDKTNIEGELIERLEDSVNEVILEINTRERSKKPCWSKKRNLDRASQSVPSKNRLKACFRSNGNLARAYPPQPKKFMKLRNWKNKQEKVSMAEYLRRQEFFLRLNEVDKNLDRVKKSFQLA